jgi:hypothetical protein
MTKVSVLQKTLEISFEGDFGVKGVVIITDGKIIEVKYGLNTAVSAGNTLEHPILLDPELLAEIAKGMSQAVELYEKVYGPTESKSSAQA